MDATSGDDGPPAFLERRCIDAGNYAFYVYEVMTHQGRHMADEKDFLLVQRGEPTRHDPMLTADKVV